MIDLDKIESYLKESLLQENVREWMVVVNKGLLGNKRVVYSTDKKDKAKEKYLWYRDMYPDIRFKLMTKTSFRAAYHRFPEYIPDDKKEQLFGVEEKDIKYGQSDVKTRYVYSPKHQKVKVPVKEPEVAKSIPQPKEKVKVKHTKVTKIS